MLKPATAPYSASAVAAPKPDIRPGKASLGKRARGAQYVHRTDRHRNRQTSHETFGQ